MPRITKEQIINEKNLEITALKDTITGLNTKVESFARLTDLFREIFSIPTAEEIKEDIIDDIKSDIEDGIDDKIDNALDNLSIDSDITICR